MNEQPKRIDIKEFREFGYLQEVNRLLLHPLGLALEVIQEEDGTERLGGVWDYRHVPEGIRFGDFDAEGLAKAVRVFEAQEDRAPKRMELLGYWVQPAGGEDTGPPYGAQA